MWDLAPWPGIEPQCPALGMQSLSHCTRQVPTFSYSEEIKLFWGNERNQVSTLKVPLKDIVFHVFFALLFCRSLFCKWFLIIHDFLRHVLDTACHHGRSEFKRGNCRVSPTPKLPPLNLSISDNKFVRTERLLWYFVFCFEASSHFTASLVARAIKNLPAMQETWVQTSLDWEDPLEKGMETHSSIRAWRTPWTGESSVLQSPIELQRARQDWATIYHFQALYCSLTYKINLYSSFTLKGLPTQPRGRWRWDLYKGQRPQFSVHWNPCGTKQFTVSTTYLNKVFISRLDFSQFYAFPLECFSL